MTELVETSKSVKSLRPWGVSRMSPYVSSDSVNVTVVGIDPVTQLAVFQDAEGNIGFHHSMKEETRGRFTSTDNPDRGGPKTPDRDHLDDVR